MPVAATAAIEWPKKLCYVGSELLPKLPLNRLHLVFEPELQFLQPDFLELFVFAEITFLSERIKTSGILQVLLSQLAKFIVIAQESVALSQHPVDLQPGFLARTYHSTKNDSMPNCGAVSL
jgi:hypothetical protein